MIYYRPICFMIGLALLCHAALPVSSCAAPGGSIATKDRAEVREILKRSWDSLGSLEFCCEEHLVQASRPREGGDTFNVFEFKWAPGNRHSMRMLRVEPDRTSRVVYETREDGHRRYAPHRVPGHPDVTSILSLSSIKSGYDEYRTLMNRVLWVVMPGGRPLYKRLDEPGTVVSTNEGGAAVIFRHKGGMVRCELDPDHDWLPRRVVLGKDARSRITVDRFARDNGRWFPVEGRSESDRNAEQKGTDSLRFVVTRFAINRPIDERDFGPPPLSDGAIVEDLTAGKARVLGGIQARRAFDKKYPVSPKATRIAEEPAEAAQGPRSFPWTLALSVGSVSCLLGALGLCLSRNRTATASG